MRTPQRLLFATLVIVAAVFPLAAVHPAAADSDRDSAITVSAILFNDETGLLKAINAARVNNDLPLLEVDPRLAGLARYRSQDMVSRRYFSHTTPDGATVFDVLDADAIPWTIAGENLARSRGMDPVAAAIDGFMNSPTHRANVLGGVYGRVGVGAAQSADGATVLAVVFTN